MSSLADTQSYLRRAVVTGDATGVVAILLGGRDPEKRLAIHRRHFETSLVSALLDKFPATVWLVGSPFVLEAARHFVHEHPPHAPCIAEYCAEFPEFLSTRPAGDRVPYLRAFAELEWRLGQAAVAIDRPPVPLETFSQIDVDVLTDAAFILQPGLHYLHASSPIDDVMKLYLTDTAPDRFALAPADVWIEVRGARGEFRINRLNAGEFIFRKAVQESRAIGDAAECALNASAGFDPSGALARLVGEGLVTAIIRGANGDAA